VPVAAIAAAYIVGRLGASAIAATAGAVPWPTPATLGWVLLTLGPAGVLVAATDRRARSVPVLLGAILLQAAALAALARARHATAPYLALKMAYLAVYPLSVGGAYVLAAVVGSLSRRFHHAEPILSWLIACLLFVFAFQSLRSSPRPVPVVTDALFDAGRWARAHVPPACVDYLVAHDDSAYWLHLAVLGNPRAGTRSTRSDTYDPQLALERWILPGGLPIAIAEHVDALPRDIRDNVDVLARFGDAAVVKRRGSADCTTRPQE